MSTESGERAAVEARAGRFLDDLRDWIAIPSISADPAHHGEVARSARWLAGALRRDGWPTVEVWSGTSPSGRYLPAVYACWPAADPTAPTVLVYGHHDVQPVDPLDAEVLFSRAGGSGLAAEIAQALGAPLAFLGVGLPDDRIHAPNERVMLPLLYRGAEAAAQLWRLLGAPR